MDNCGAAGVVVLTVARGGATAVLNDDVVVDVNSCPARRRHSRPLAVARHTRHPNRKSTGTRGGRSHCRRRWTR